ncbi:hypothetical protein LTR70_004726 [Exophiala xenobiotica]|uniref:Tyrosyl-DNA phosphodiesterase n=1 Tax=Lithohypha guttulata TaxID=1690604 RepID=A0ABR0KCA6_9EURO|nr:hypothetical protein LTR24_004342 [Lithohypha guttulata]KAK5319940.1 hypothetical protein LTR70_004726 [Exophiala xenobiotica]
MDAEPPAKKPRLDGSHAEQVRAQRSAFLSTLSRSVSPPRSRSSDASTLLTSDKDRTQTRLQPETTPPQQMTSGRTDGQTYVPNGVSFTAPNGTGRAISSPFQLTRVRDLPAKDNIDTVSLHDILGDPLIKQAWIFNFCFDVNWTMQHFDADVRRLVDVKVVHGSWRQEDGNRLGIEKDLKAWKNVQEIRAYLPDPFGTHHSKMIILFKHDDTAQVVIHTANMLEKDWDHMTQAAWKSPVLPLMQRPGDKKQEVGKIGSGDRFKHDLLRYLNAYGSKLKPLCEQLLRHDFSAIRAALVASVPSYVKPSDPPDKRWGHLALADALAAVESSRPTKSPPGEQRLVCQVSSIATLPAAWLTDTIVKAACTSVARNTSTSIIYPAPTDLRNALTGYATGGSIHTKIASAAQQKQVAALRPQLHRWGAQSSVSSAQAGRHMIPPHIKTYICYSSKPTLQTPTPEIDWVLVSSANLSTQAWGTAPRAPATVKRVKGPGEAVSHISSFEIGVLVWPELFLDEPDGKAKARMVPSFGKDTPDLHRIVEGSGDEVIVGMRMPYDLPLTPYGPTEMPWSPSATYDEPDRLGQTWT